MSVVTSVTLKPVNRCRGLLLSVDDLESSDGVVRSLPKLSGEFQFRSIYRPVLRGSKRTSFV